MSASLGLAGRGCCPVNMRSPHQLSVVVLEQRDWLGGVWNYSDDPNIITVMESTVTSSSATVTEAADFPMKPELGNFLHRKDIQALAA